MKENEVCEDCLDFVHIEKMDAQTIANTIISSVTKMVFNLKLGTIAKMQHMFTAVHTFWP